MVTHQPEDSVGAILTLRQRRVARTLTLRLWHANLRLRDLQLVVGIGFASSNFLARQLTIADRIHALDAVSCIAIGNSRHFQRVKRTELSNLVEGERRIVDEPDSSCLRHEKRMSHKQVPLFARVPSRAVDVPPKFRE